MTKKIKYLYFFLILILLSSCSFDKKTGIWSGEEKEKIRIIELEKEQKRISNTIKVYSTDYSFSEEIPATKTINLS